MHKTFTRRSAIAIIGGAVSSIALPVFAKQFETNGVAINGTGSHGILHRTKIGRCLNAILKICTTIWLALCLCHVKGIYCLHGARGMDDL